MKLIRSDIHNKIRMDNSPLYYHFDENLTIVIFHQLRVKIMKEVKKNCLVLRLVPYFNEIKWYK